MSQDKKKSHRKILIIDDERSMRKALVLELRERGYIVDEASHFQQGLSFIRNSWYNVVITDLFINKNEQGLDLVRELKTRQPRTRAIVITSNDHSRQTSEKAREAGADYFRIKGFTSEELLALLN